ncbi:MAG: DUF4364 family protein [Clostridium sp.]|nr:DUF4364 family protein [Acetatifactor muris]MCM1526905.1 DUF4364 family protein [Bacteroides sp.]MCM1563301.1 DUF4364 family protein [Clostridium sp.]
MLQDPLTLYKLIILYMLDRVNFPLTKAQVTDFILEREYTGFLTLQQAIGELIESDMVAPQTIGNRTHLAITEEGARTLSYFGNRVSDSIKQDIDAYFKEHEMTLRNEVSVQSNYYKATSGEYEARLVAKDRDISLVDITLSVPSREVAAAICDKWQDKNETIYQYLIQELF